ncbi:MAG: transposase [Candidatus Heimdallarchaeota archaeon]|nr:transposase [Candidatus Heimdallarchaeota archaeon]
MSLRTNIKSYKFKVVMGEQKALHNFKGLVSELSNDLLAVLWSEKWIRRLGEEKRLRPYNVITLEEINSLVVKKNLYLPSRIKRGIVEYVGRIVKSHYKSWRCYKDILELIAYIGFEHSINKIYQILYNSAKNKFTRYIYKKNMVQKLYHLIRKLNLAISLDFTMIPYSILIKPVLKSFNFLYSTDDGQALKYNCKVDEITYQIKLPLRTKPLTNKDWAWFEGQFKIPERILEKFLQVKIIQLKKPILTYKLLKGGKGYFFIHFPWIFPKNNFLLPYNNRKLSVDLGVNNLAVCVVCENGNQLSHPIFIRIHSSIRKQIDRRYKHLSGLESHLRELKNGTTGHIFTFNKLSIEYQRLTMKQRNIHNQIAHDFCNTLIKIAFFWHCQTIIFEDLRNYKAKGGSKKISRRNNDWLRGKIRFIITYKSKLHGLTIIRVSPYFTSTHCARCGYTKGLKVRDSKSLLRDTKGRWFYCPKCHFSVDRDYNAALNIYRAHTIDYVQAKSLAETQPIPLAYIARGTPLNHPSGGLDISNSIITVSS